MARYAMLSKHVRVPATLSSTMVLCGHEHSAVHFSDPSPNSIVVPAIPWEQLVPLTAVAIS